MKKPKFIVKYVFEVNNKRVEGIEKESGWYYIDQRGNILEASPLKPPEECQAAYNYIQPFFKINDNYLSIDEIEKLIKKDRKTILKQFKKYWGDRGEKWNGKLNIMEWSRKIWLAAYGHKEDP